jgi:hypothetical protein
MKHNLGVISVSTMRPNLFPFMRQERLRMIIEIKKSKYIEEDFKFHDTVTAREVEQKLEKTKDELTLSPKRRPT